MVRMSPIQTWAFTRFCTYSAGKVVPIGHVQVLVARGSAVFVGTPTTRPRTMCAPGLKVVFHTRVMRVLRASRHSVLAQMARAGNTSSENPVFDWMGMMMMMTIPFGFHFLLVLH